MEEEKAVPDILQNVHFLALEGKDTGMLWEIRPAYILVHDPDIALVRQIEVHCHFPTQFIGSCWQSSFFNEIHLRPPVQILQGRSKNENMTNQNPTLPNLLQILQQAIQNCWTFFKLFFWHSNGLLKNILLGECPYLKIGEMVWGY